jgi:hypothetical protein
VPTSFDRKRLFLGGFDWWTIFFYTVDEWVPFQGGDMADLILEPFRSRKKLEQILSEEREKMFSEPKLVVKERRGQSHVIKTSKRKKGKTCR